METFHSVAWFGANSSYEEIEIVNSTHVQENETNLSSNSLPATLTEISESSLMCVVAYCLVFVAATSGNLIFLKSLWKQYKTKHSRISLLLLHLSLADLIVCCTLIPTEIFWRLTIQWRGGNLLCKLTQFLIAFGLYLSSLVLICVSVDRFLAIVFPLNVVKVGSYHRIKVMLISAWKLATLFSVPQAIFFGVVAHPEFPTFKQCVTNDFLEDSRDVKIYSIFSVAVMYFIPLLVIIVTYSAIIIKLVRKSGTKRHFSVYRYSGVQARIYRRGGLPSSSRQGGKITTAEVQLRCSSNAKANISHAKSRTLLMTVVIVLAFVFCWTPYAVMTLWYMVDREGAEKVDPRVQDALFLMAVANSCVNPLIYRGFAKRCSTRKQPACSQF